MRAILSVSVEPALKRKLEKAARISKKKKSDLVKDALERYLAEMEFRTLREQSIKFGKKSGLITDEDVFKVVS
ncbi:MAG: CopG family transcriptional regulator [Spirochaetales bacterium]|nr:CopG family transcriptional regulator [Spirochaetales bacterium]